MNNQIVYFAALALLLGVAPSVHAEGAQNAGGWQFAFGANRVAHTESGNDIAGETPNGISGVTGVRGHFSAPDFYLPITYLVTKAAEGADSRFPRMDQNLYGTGAYNASSLSQYFADIKAAGQTVDKAAYFSGSNSNDDKPTLYLGSSSGNNVVDAGVQYEWMPLNGNAAGWAPLISNQTAFDSMTIKRIEIGASGMDIEYVVNPTNGTVELILSGISTPVRRTYGKNAANPNGIVVYNVAERSNLSMKRIQGITQRRGVVGGLDGAFMRNSIFSGGELRRADTGQFTKWSWVDTNNAVTGYRPDGVDRGNPSEAPTFRDPRYIVDFPALTVAAVFEGVPVTRIRPDVHDGYWQNQKIPAALENRYAFEQVDINLRTGGARAHGLRSTLGKKRVK